MNKLLYPCVALLQILGCASAQKGVAPGLTTCVSDPLSQKLLCQNEYGTYDVPFSEATGFICSPYKEFQKLLLEASRR